MDSSKIETMMKILVGSQNPVKIEATKEAFSTYFGKVEVRGIKVDSKVSNQPTNDETFHGARNRAFGLKRINDKKILYRFSLRKSMPERHWKNPCGIFASKKAKPFS